MTRFNYKIQNNTGKIETGAIDATDKFSLAAQFRNEGKVVVSIDEFHQKDYLKMEFLNEMLSRIKLQDKIIFARNLSAMINAGLSLSRALGVLERQTTNLKFKKVLQSLTENISKGKSLSDGMKEYPKVFPQLFVSMVGAGEESGNLADSLLIVGNQLEKTYLLKKKIKGAMIYPAIVISAMVVIAILMFIFVVPTLSDTFTSMNVKLPTSTSIIIGISEFLRDHGILALIIVVVAVVVISMAIRTPLGKRYAELILLHLPIISKIVKESNAARTTRTLSSLLSAGVDVVEALSITKSVVQNSYYKDVLTIAGENVQKGIPLSSIFMENSKIYPVLVGEMIEVGEETGKLSDMLLRVAEFYESEVDTATRDLSTIIEPILMVVIGGGVGFFAISMITPMYTIMTGI
ncbi:MAG: type II secretion system F family protein [bacterium]|nr:type II secretion system F family protein [bacterium]